MKLLTRDQFRERVFARDQHRCVVCGAPAVDAHHILERRLFPDGGYYLENGVSLCAPCHIQAEDTSLSCERLRELAKITTIVLPPQLTTDQRYDKWANPILPNGTRLRGELFYDESVQKILHGVIGLFTDRVKYPRTYHLPWSPGRSADDRVMTSLSGLEGHDVVITEKMDGENTTLMRDRLHARSLEWDAHPSRTMVRALHARIAHDIPEGWRLCGENMQAVHSIRYRELADVFLLFSVWDERNRCLPWDETRDWARLLDLTTVPTLYRAPWNEKYIRELHQTERDGNPCEGYVVRITAGFQYADFRRNVAKYVRSHHVQTDQHWMHQQIELNGFAKKS
jgi:hypothetical protein